MALEVGELGAVLTTPSTARSLSAMPRPPFVYWLLNQEAAVLSLFVRGDWTNRAFVGATDVIAGTIDPTA